jgi:hypothetical protein
MQVNICGVGRPGVSRVERLRRKLGGCEARSVAPLTESRRGRSRAYHDKLVAMILDEEAKLIGHLGGVVAISNAAFAFAIRKASGKFAPWTSSAAT